MYSIDDEFTFGKYQGFTVAQVFSGQKYLTQNFINNFLSYRLNDLSFRMETDIPHINYAVKITDLKIFGDNKLSFNLTFNGSTERANLKLLHAAFFELSSYLEFDDRSKESIEIYDSANNIILEINSVTDGWYPPSADPSYIEWCINNLDVFYLRPSDLMALENNICHHFYGLQLYSNCWCSLYKYEPIMESRIYKFSELTKKLNEKKSGSLR